MSPVVSAISHVALRVRDLDSAIETATGLAGLSISEERDGRVYMTHGSAHHSLVYIEDDVDALDHVGLTPTDPESMREIRRRVELAGLSVTRDEPLNAGVRDGFAFEGPEGFVFEIAEGMSRKTPTATPTGVRPLRFSHVNLSPRDPGKMISMLETVLDFRLSDRVGQGGFYRCNADHHGIGVLPGAGVIHHYAWEVADLAALARLADLVDERGGSTLWGPGRHGVGRNIATYYEEPCGIVVEFCAEMMRIYDESSYEPGHWDLAEGHKWFSRWAPWIPEDFRGRGIPPVRVAREREPVSDL